MTDYVFIQMVNDTNLAVTNGNLGGIAPPKHLYKIVVYNNCLTHHKVDFLEYQINIPDQEVIFINRDVKHLITEEGKECSVFTFESKMVATVHKPIVNNMRLQTYSYGSEEFKMEDYNYNKSRINLDQFGLFIEFVCSKPKDLVTFRLHNTEFKFHTIFSEQREGYKFSDLLQEDNDQADSERYYVFLFPFRWNRVNLDALVLGPDVLEIRAYN